MKQEYEIPTANITYFQTEDILTASGDNYFGGGETDDE